MYGLCDECAGIIRHIEHSMAHDWEAAHGTWKDPIPRWGDLGFHSSTHSRLSGHHEWTATFKFYNHFRSKILVQEWVKTFLPLADYYDHPFPAGTWLTASEPYAHDLFTYKVDAGCSHVFQRVTDLYL